MEQIEKNCIYHADCMDMLRQLPEKSVDLVIADPPYYRMKGDFDLFFRQFQNTLHGVGHG